MKILVSIVSNSRPAYVAEPVTDGDKVTEIVLEPVTAWKVIYELDENSDVGSSVPITINMLTSTYAVYYSDTDMWSIPENTCGKGLNTLLEYFQKSVK